MERLTTKSENIEAAVERIAERVVSGDYIGAKTAWDELKSKPGIHSTDLSNAIAAIKEREQDLRHPNGIFGNDDAMLAQRAKGE